MTNNLLEHVKSIGKGLINEYLEFCKKENIKTGYHQKLETTIVSDWWIKQAFLSQLKTIELVKEELEKEKGNYSCHECGSEGFDWALSKAITLLDTIIQEIKTQMK